jgi:hypothetical protein
VARCGVLAVLRTRLQKKTRSLLPAAAREKKVARIVA